MSNSLFSDPVFNNYAEAMDWIKQEIEKLRAELKAHHTIAWAFISELITKIETMTTQLKEGWGKATICSEQMASDISIVQNDISNIKKIANRKLPDWDPKDKKKQQDWKDAKAKQLTDMKDAAKLFSKHYDKFQKDGVIFESEFPDPTKKLPDGSNLKDLFDKIHGISNLIDKTDITYVTNPDEHDTKKQITTHHTVADLLAMGRKGGDYTELAKAFLDFGKIPDSKTSNDAAGSKDAAAKGTSNDDTPTSAQIDTWNDGASGYDGLDTTSSVNDLLKTEGQRNLNKYETMISTMNNIGSNCVKNLNDLFQYMVQKQIAG